MLFSLLLPLTAQSHEAGVTDTGIEIARDSLKLVYTVPIDLVAPLGFESTQVSNTTVAQTILDGFSISNSDTPCKGSVTGQRTLDTIDSAQFDFQFNCGGPVTRLNMDYNLFFEQDQSHSNIVRISLLGRSQDVTLSSSQREHSVDIESLVRQIAAARQSANTTASDSTSAPSGTFGQTFSGTQYFPVGIKHILLGFDHMLFVLCLVLMPMSAVSILALVTSFTIAHTITLSLSVLNMVSLPPRPIEAIIALSIIYVSARTIWILRHANNPVISESQIRERLLSSFLFGLIHGFGFSYVLKEIGLGDQAFLSLLFFNLGVETGQLLILVVLLPLIWWLDKRFPSWYWARAASVLTGLIGLFWFLQRLAII